VVEWVQQVSQSATHADAKLGSETIDEEGGGNITFQAISLTEA
jgi:hypothetical protein